MTISASILSAKSGNALISRDKTSVNLYNDTGTIQHIALYEQSSKRRAGPLRNHGPWDTRPIPSAKGANRSTRWKTKKGPGPWS